MKYFFTFVCFYFLSIHWIISQDKASVKSEFQILADSLYATNSDSLNSIIELITQIEKQILKSDSLSVRAYRYRKIGVFMYGKSNFYLAEKMFVKRDPTSYNTKPVS